MSTDLETLNHLRNMISGAEAYMSTRGPRSANDHIHLRGQIDAAKLHCTALATAIAAQGKLGGAQPQQGTATPPPPQRQALPPVEAYDRLLGLLHAAKPLVQAVADAARRP